MAEITTPRDEIREQVRKRYADAAKAATTSSDGGCCAGESGCGPTVLRGEEQAVFGRSRYSSAEQAELPDTAALASLGCGNPTAVAELHEGETVLDLGSGGGSTCCSPLSASDRPAGCTAWT